MGEKPLFFSWPASFFPSLTPNCNRFFFSADYAFKCIQDGYLAACQIVERKPTIDSKVFTKQEILDSKAVNIKTGKPLTAADLTKEEYTGKDFDDEVFIEMKTPAMCEDLFQQLCENGGPEQKVKLYNVLRYPEGSGQVVK